jgi:cytoskeletal protein RodZ
MKQSIPNQFFKKQLLNIVFLVLIVGGALTVYFIARAEQPKGQVNASASRTATAESQAEAAVPKEASKDPAAQDETANASENAATGDASAASDAATAGEQAAAAAPEPTAEPKRVVGVPEDVFATHLATSDLFDAKRSANDPNSWTLTYGEQSPLEVGLQYTVDDGAVSSLELSFQLPPQYDAKSKSTIEQYLAKSAGKVAAAREEAVRALLPDLLPACDQNDALTRASVRIWTEEMLRISSDKDDYRDKADGCTFYAYQMARDEGDVLICLFVLEQ